MIGGRVAPACDELGVFLDLLTHLRDVRVAAKRQAQAADTEEERRHQLALSQSFKILINSFYGYLGFSSAHWNDFEAANRVTTEGRAVVTSIVERLQTLGATPVEADTDGVYFTPPPGHRAEDDARLLAMVAEKLPPGITLELDGRYPAMFSYKMKTYALLDDRGRVTLKGSAFRSRGLEPFQRRLIDELVGLLLRGRRTDAKAVVDRWLGEFAAHRVPVRDFARTETLQESLEVYRERVTAGLRSTSAAYELATASGQRTGAFKVRGAVNKLATLWDPARPDENVEYYQSKVLETWERFRRFTEHDGLVPYVDDAPESSQLSLF